MDVVEYGLSATKLMRRDPMGPRAIAGCQLADVEFRFVKAGAGSRRAGYLPVTLLGPPPPKGGTRLTATALVPVITTPLPVRVQEVRMSRRGLTLAEAAIALLLIAARVASVMDLCRATSRGAQADVERLAEDQLIGDALEALIVQSGALLERTSREPDLLFWLMEKRIRICPDAARPAAARALERLRELSVELEARAGGHPELVPVRTRLFRLEQNRVVEAPGRRP